MYDFSTLAACKTSILTILSTPKDKEPSGVDYFLANEWGGYRLAFLPNFSYEKGEKVFVIPRMPGCDMKLFDEAVRELLKEGKIVQYDYNVQWKGSTLQIVAGLSEREQEFNLRLKRTAA